MSDITKCIDGRCPSRKNCWRYQAPAPERQPYTDFQRDHEAERCATGFWPMDGEPPANQQRTKSEPRFDSTMNQQ